MNAPKRPTGKEVKRAFEVLALCAIYEHRDLMEESDDDDDSCDLTWKQVRAELSDDDILADACMDFDSTVAEYAKKLLRKFK